MLLMFREVPLLVSVRRAGCRAESWRKDFLVPAFPSVYVLGWSIDGETGRREEGRES